MKYLEDIDCTFPSTLAEALEIQADKSTRGVPLAGGTDLMVQWPTGAVDVPARAVSLLAIPELKAIEETNDALVIGAAVTHMELRRSKAVCRCAPSLAQAAATVGGTQIQTMGTIAGSVANASPAGDLAPSLLVTDGTVVVASASGEREIELAKFWLDYRKIDLKPDELIVRFILPKLHDGCREGFRKLGPRAAQAISKVMASYRGSVRDGRVRYFRAAFGSVAPTSVRLYDLEQWIEGQPLTESTMEEAEQRTSELVQPISDIRSTAEYRKWVCGRIVRGFLEELTG